METASNYVVAGVDTFVQLMSRFIDKSGGEYFDDGKLNDMLHQTVNKYLLSFGTGLSYKTKKLPKKLEEKFMSVVDFVRNRPLMKDVKLYWDSGGFQVANGALNTSDMPGFMDMYYNTIAQNPNKFEQAFILDMPPGPGSVNIFKSYDQVEEINRMSYQKCIQMVPPDIRKKVIYIHHFRTPSLFKTWNKFLFEEDLADGYEYFGTGGIVANMSSDITIPIIIYTLPLSSIVLYAKQKGIQQFKFHVLGGANFIDVFYHQLFSHHIKQFHNIDVEITYDSSAIFKGLAIGRFVHVLNEFNHLVKMDLRSKNLGKTFNQGTVSEQVYHLMEQLTKKYDYKLLKEGVDHIYDPATKTLGTAMHMYLICYVLDMYKIMEEISKQQAKDIYPYYLELRDEYRSKEISPGLVFGENSFDMKCNEITKFINQGKNTKKQEKKFPAIFTSLRCLEELDIEYNEKLVEKNLTKDDISTLGGGGLQTWDD